MNLPSQRFTTLHLPHYYTKPNEHTHTEAHCGTQAEPRVVTQQVCVCHGTWVRSPPVSPCCPPRASVFQTAALSAGEGETTRGGPPFARHRDSRSLRQRGEMRKRSSQKVRRNLRHHKVSGCQMLTCQLHIVAQLSGD